MSSFDRFSILLGIRYLLSGTSGFSKLVNVISVIGLALGIILMIVVSSVHHGLSAARQASLLNVVPHAFLADSDTQIDEFRAIVELADVIDFRREFHGTVLVRGEKLATFTFELTGVEAGELRSQELPLVEGTLEKLRRANGIVISDGIALHLGVNVDDLLDLSFVKPTEAGLETRTMRFTVVGRFKQGIEGDAHSAYVDLDYLAEMNLLNSGEVGWNITVKEPMNVDEIFESFDSVVTWTDSFGEAYRSFQFERMVMYLVMTLVLLLASFNIVAGQSMLINIKRAEIAILSTMGASRRQLTLAFFIQGGTIAVFGVVLGVLGGFAIALNFNEIFELFDDMLGVTLLEGSRFNEWPSKISARDAVGSILIALVLGTIALIRPLVLALRESPVVALSRTH